ncbi:hypothetical protein [Acinetobacter sp.]|uniref:hypothetical protein n=1 Tax=Acinetobacter sp. TaxID=472 RepID=UPI0028A2D719|nr:hypothetical protein [Acinetobacter sp.]
MSDLVYMPTDEDVFDSLQAALEFIESVASDLNDALGWSISVCKIIKPTHSWFVRSKDLVNDMQNRASDEFSEWADDYLNDVEYDKVKLAELDLLIANWFSSNAKEPDFYQAGEEVQVIIVTKELLDEHGIQLEARQ